MIKKNITDTEARPMASPSILSTKLNAFVMTISQHIVIIIFNHKSKLVPVCKKKSGEEKNRICTPRYTSKTEAHSCPNSLVITVRLIKSSSRPNKKITQPAMSTDTNSLY